VKRRFFHNLKESLALENFEREMINKIYSIFIFLQMKKKAMVY